MTLTRGRYKTREGNIAVVESFTSPNAIGYGATDAETGYYAYGYVQLKNSLRRVVWKTSSGNKIYSKAPKPNRDDIVDIAS